MKNTDPCGVREYLSGLGKFSFTAVKNAENATKICLSSQIQNIPKIFLDFSPIQSMRQIQKKVNLPLAGFAPIWHQTFQIKKWHIQVLGPNIFTSC